MESSTNPHDDDLEHFEAHGAAPLPVPSDEGYAEHEGARIWYASYGAGAPVILLHGGLGHSGNWGYQVPALLGAGHRVVVVDSRGHGRSTRDARPYRYELMASDVLAVMDTLQLERAALVGWSDGACVAMVLGSTAPQRVAGVFFFGCNMDPSGTKAVRADAGDRALLQPSCERLRAAIVDTGRLRGVCRRGQHDDENRAQLFRRRSGSDRCAGRDRAKRARRIHQAGTRRLSRPQHSRRGVDPAARREPFRPAATAGAIQSRNARFPAPDRGLIGTVALATVLCHPARPREGRTGNPFNFTMRNDHALRKKSWCVAQNRHFAMSPHVAHRETHTISLSFCRIFFDKARRLTTTCDTTC
ncbi:pimeloyl-ACP methyl ester carboxylesterase [Paraburkholderia sp. BL9I2N2]|nr:pimeloyl-ACP methyl ester carboxylesterase [Paraburkholderia sp. BL9I2N2]